MINVLLLNNVPAPYFNPLFELLGREPDWRLTVCYVSDWNRDVAWRETGLETRANSHRTVILDRMYPALSRLLGSSAGAAIAVLAMLVRERPDYLVCYGYTLKPQMTALLWAMITGVPFAVAGDANVYIDNPTGLKRMLKGLWLRRVTARAAALIVIGTANRLFWESYGAKPGQLFEARFAVDNEHYRRACETVKETAFEMRALLGFAGRTVFLYAGRLVRRKNVDLIIRAARQLQGDRIAVIIAGDGEDRDRLETLADGSGAIHFAGRVEPGDLPLYYAMSDVLILPAEQEPWGLVVNEAMAAGLAIIAHRHCGAAVDLVDQENGCLLRDFSADELAREIQRLAGDEELVSSMKMRSKEKIKAWSVESAAQGIARAIRQTAVNAENNR